MVVRSPPSSILLKLKHHNLWIRSQAQRRSPGSGAAGSKNLHFADLAQAVNKLPVHSTRQPAPGDELPQMRVSGELQGDAGGLGDLGIVGRMGQQYAGATSVETE